MTKRIITLISAIVLCLIMLSSVSVITATPLDTSKKASLMLNYTKDSEAFADMEIAIYRVAEAHEDGIFELIEPFSSFPVNIHDIMSQDCWTTISDTLNAYIVANEISPDKEAYTNSDGIVEFKNLEVGLYLVRETVGENSKGTYIFNRFFVYLPTPQPDSSYDYSVVANPKCTKFIPVTEYTVTKLWQDGVTPETRPNEVTVDIFSNGILKETQILNSQNNWSYCWSVSSDDIGTWTVTEKNITEPYNVTITQNGNTFTIINSFEEEEPTPPQTGDIFALPLWVFIMSLSGIMLLLLGLYNRRNKCKSVSYR